MDAVPVLSISILKIVFIRLLISLDHLCALSDGWHDYVPESTDIKVLISQDFSESGQF